jgi:outer membrane immunogenic protein
VRVAVQAYAKADLSQLRGLGYRSTSTGMKEVIMGRAPFASLTSISLAAAAFAATSLVTAHAADLKPVITKAPPPVYYNWTGFYLGVNLGGSWGHQSAHVFEDGVNVFSASTNPDGVIGGGQIGYNWQFAPWFGWGTGTVLGIEADIQGSGQRDTHDFSVLAPGVLIPALAGTGVDGDITDKLEWFGTVRGRIGIAFDRFLPYFTGGWAYGERKFDGTVTAFDAATGVPLGTTSFSTSSSLSDGWTVGGGFEWAFWDHWTAKFEYLYIDFGNANNNLNNLVFVTPAGTTAGVSTSHFTDNVARVGVNYRF